MFIQNFILVYLVVLINCLFFLNFVLCKPNNDDKSVINFDFFNQTIQFRNDSFATKRTIKNDLINRSLVDLMENSTKNSFDDLIESSLKNSFHSFDYPSKKPFKKQTKQFANVSTSESSQIKTNQNFIKTSFDLIESSTSLSVVINDDQLIAKSPIHSEQLIKLQNDESIEILPKPQARVQQPQHTRSRTGGTTVDLATSSSFGKPKIQYLNQTKPQASYMPNEPDTVIARKSIKDNSKPVDLHIGALFPMTSSHSSGWLGGQGCRPAIYMALKDVNNAPDLLPSYHLVLHHNDSKCDPGLGTTVLYDLIYNPPTKLLILGGCSIVCSTIAETAKMYNLVVVGYGWFCKIIVILLDFF